MAKKTGNATPEVEVDNGKPFDIRDLVGAIQKLNDDRGQYITLGNAIPTRDLVPFYHHVLNLITYGGFPFGCIHEFFGHSQTGKCLTGDTLLQYADGRCPKMEDLIMPKDWSASDLTLPPHTLLEDETWYTMKETRDFCNAQGEKEAANRFYYGGKQNCISIYMDNHITLTGTPEHVLPVAIGLTDEDLIGETIELSLQQIKDKLDAGEEIYLLQPFVNRKANFDYFGPCIENMDMPGPHAHVHGDDENGRLTTAFILGYLSHKLLYDPRQNNNLRVVYTTASGEEAERANAITRNQVVEALAQWDCYYGREDALNDKRFSKWAANCEAFGHNLSLVEIPACIRMGNEYVRKEYVRGLLRAQDYCSSDAPALSYQFRTPSKAFAHQLNALLLGLGILPIISKEKDKWVFTFVPYTSARLLSMLNTTIIDNDAFRLLAFKNYAERSAWLEVCGAAPAAGSVENIPIKILKATLLLNKYPVYDLEMPQTHHYVANGFASHNSFFMYRMAAECQRIYPNSIVLMIDKENAYNAERGAELGLNNNNVIYYPPYVVDMPSTAISVVEDVQGFLMKKHSKTNIPKLIVIVDSVAAFKSGVKRGSENMGKSAKHWHEAFREFMDMMYPNVMMLVSNHVTFNPNVMFGSNLTKAQANATNYYRSCGLGLEHGRPILDDNGDRIGEWLVAIVDKSRQGPSYRKAMIPFFYNQALSTPLDGYLRFLAGRGILEPKNKDEFKKCQQKTLIYHAGKEKITLMEDKPYEVLQQYPQLWYTDWPAYGGGAWAAEMEQEAIDTYQHAYNRQVAEEQSLSGAELVPIEGGETVEGNIHQMLGGS